MPAVHGSFPRPCRVVMARKVRTSMGRTNAAPHENDQGAMQGVNSLNAQKKQRVARQCDADGELPIAIGHDPSLHKNVVHRRHVGREDSHVREVDSQVQARQLRRGLRESYAKLVGGRRPQSAGEVQDQLANDCGILVPDELAHELALLVGTYHKPAEKAVEMILFGQVN